MPDSHHDIVVIGASAGGIPPLLELLRGLPAGLPASLFIVIHRTADSIDESMAVSLQRAASLTCVVPRHGERIKKGFMYLAPADQHMIVKENRILITRGPRENYFRPSIDTTFRSAAVAFGARVIGIILSGLMQDGTAGMEAIKRCGGLCMVQQPSDAEFPSMPQTVLSNLDVDYSVTASEMYVVLQELILRQVDTNKEKPADLVLEAQIAERYVNTAKDSIITMDIEQTSKELDKVAHRTPISCPECGGAIWRMNEGKVERYRCHLGHAFTAESMLGHNRESLEETLWVALRMLEERKYVLVTLAEEMAETNPGKATVYKERADELHVHVERIRLIINNYDGSGFIGKKGDRDEAANAS